MQTMQEVIQKYKLKNLGGSDNFKNDEFDAIEWSAPIIQEPRILKEYLDASGIVGSTIKEIAIVGDNVSGLDGIWVSSLYYDEYHVDSDGIEHKIPADYIKTLEWLKDYTTILATYDIDTPVIIITDKGNFEIDSGESSTVRISKNCIPENMYAHDSKMKMSFDIRKLFANLQGKKIIGYDIERETDFYEADFTFTGSLGMKLPENQECYIKNFKLILDDGQKLLFTNDYDWIYLALLDKDDKNVIINGKQIESFLRIPIQEFKYK